MAYIGPEPNPGQNREVDDISSGFNGSEVNFTLQVNGQNVSPGSSNNIIVSLGGVVQNPGTDYNVAASTLTFTTAPANGLSFFGLVLGQQVDIQSLADGTSPTMSAPSITGDLSIADKIVHTGDTNTAIRFPAADTITAETAGSERLRVDSSGNVGIGTVSPGAKIHAASGSDSVVGARIAGGTSGGTDIADFRTNNGTIRMKINNDVTVSTGNIVIGTDGKGIDFSNASPSNAGASSNILDDYEEGTFTPTFDFSGVFNGTISGQHGTYTKIGRMVNANIRISLSSKGSHGGNATVGLPFTCVDILAGTSIEASGFIGYFNHLNTNVSALGGTAQDGTSTAILRGNYQGGNSFVITNNSINDNFEFRLSVTYATNT